MTTDCVEDDALSQRPLTDRHLVDLEQLHRDREELGPGDDELDPLRVEALDLLALARGGRHELLVQGFELRARERELVQGAGDRLVTPRRHHLGEIFERAAAADGELRLELHDVDGERTEDVDEVLAEATAVALRDGVRVHELCTESRDPESFAR